MSTPCDAGLPKAKVSTGNAQADSILEQVRSLPTAGDMAAHFYRMHRIFDAKHRVNAAVSDGINRNAISTDALGDRVDPHLLDTEDDATEDEGGQRIAPSLQAVARQSLYVATSNVIPWWSKGGGLGLFSSKPINAGDLLGFYTGTWYREEDYADLPAAQRQRLDEYAVTVEPQLHRREGDDAVPMVVSPPFKLGLEGLIRRCTPLRLPTRQARLSPQMQHTPGFSSLQTTSQEPSPPTRLMASGWDSPCTPAGTSESTERSWFTTVTTSRALATATRRALPAPRRRAPSRPPPWDPCRSPPWPSSRAPPPTSRRTATSRTLDPEHVR